MIIYLPVPSRVKKFLAKEFGLPFQINNYNLVLGLITENTLHNEKEDTIGVKLPNESISKLITLHDFINYFEHLFWNSFVFWVKARTYSNNQSTFQAIRDFMDCYDITEAEFSEESARRMVQRRNQKNRKKMSENKAMEIA